MESRIFTLCFCLPTTLMSDITIRETRRTSTFTNRETNANGSISLRKQAVIGFISWNALIECNLPRRLCLIAVGIG